MTPDSRKLEPLLEDASVLLKALAHPARLMICCELRDEEMSVGDIEETLGIRQPRLSRELAKLREDGLVEARRQSKLIFYTLSKQPRVRQMVDVICAVMLSNTSEVKTATNISAARVAVTRSDGCAVFARTQHLDS